MATDDGVIKPVKTIRCATWQRTARRQANGWPSHYHPFLMALAYAAIRSCGAIAPEPTHTPQGYATEDLSRLFPRSWSHMRSMIYGKAISELNSLQAS
jgi:hypothetical protein